jgi:competence protein ComEC
MLPRWLSTLCAILALGSRGALAQERAHVDLIFLDVGQADAIVVRSPEGKTALIDAGGSSIVHLLAALGIDTIDLAIASHAHADHIGGMAEVLRTFPVRYYMDNGTPHTTTTYQSLMSQLEASDVGYLEATARTISLGSVTLRILPPPAEGDHNNRSVGLVIEFGEFRAVLTGDSEWPELEHFLGGGVPDVTVLKAAHHGSNNGVTPEWLATTRPEIVVISVGAGNPYGHPHLEALGLYLSAGPVYRTDIHGTIAILATRDGAFEVTTAADSPPAAGRSTRNRDPIPAAASDSVPGFSLSVQADAPGNDHNNLNGEYVILRNTTSTSIMIDGWTLCDLARHCYTFPAAAVIGPADSVLVFTGPGRDGRGHFYMGFGRAVWNNDGDGVILTDRRGRVVLHHVY